MKRLSEAHFSLRLEQEFGRLTKRMKTAAMVQCQWGTNQAADSSIILPVQLEVLELGPFWTSAAAACGGLSPLQACAVETSPGDCSLGAWAGVEQQVSVSLMQRSASGCADAEDEDTQDTATSSGSEGCLGEARQQRAPARKPRTAATGEEDSITSSQPVPTASVAFSFGSRPCLTPDLTAVQCWDVVNGLLAAV